MKKKILAGFIVVFGSAALWTQAYAQTGHDHGAAGHANTAQTSAQAISSAKLSTSLTVTGCWIRSIPAPAPSAGYFVVKNSGNNEVKLQAASSPAYGMIMLHQTTQKDGMSKMSETHDIAIAAGSQLEFKPGGYHAMLEKPVKVPTIGSHVNMDFLFDNGEKASAQCEVKAPNTKTPMSH
ncbi:copper chaperone PCu(A)C [Alcaligenaceae bacterium]|nr:copper chaperone PCu(A)C [Alcaligenaceae bacterium]